MAKRRGIFFRLVRRQRSFEAVKLKDVLPQTYINETTYLESPVSEIPTENLFVSSDHYAFDVSELVKTWEVSFRLLNPNTGQIFLCADRMKLSNYSLVQAYASDLRNRIQSQSQLIDDKMQEAVKNFVHEFYENNSDGVKSSAAYRKFNKYLNKLPDGKRDALCNYLIITKDRISTFGQLLQNIEQTEECAHTVSYLLWKFVSDFDSSFIDSEAKKVKYYSNADPRLWIKFEWKQESLTVEQQLACLGVKDDFWQSTHYPLITNRKLVALT